MTGPASSPSTDPREVDVLRLPELITVQGIQAELNVTRAEAERIMRRVPRRIQFVERGRVYAYRADVVELLRKHEAAA